MINQKVVLFPSQPKKSTAKPTGHANNMLDEIKKDQKTNYPKMGQETGWSINKLHQLEDQTRRLIERIDGQPNTTVFAQTIVKMLPVQDYLTAINLKPSTFMDYLDEFDYIKSIKEPLAEEQLLTYGIELLELSQTIYNTLMKRAITTVGDILNYSPKQIRNIRGISQRRQKYIIEQAIKWCDQETIAISNYAILKQDPINQPTLHEKYVFESTESIESLTLTKRVIERLHQTGLSSINDLLGKNTEQLREIRGIGEKALDDIERALDQYRYQKFDFNPASKQNTIQQLGLPNRAINAFSRVRNNHEIKTINDLLNTPYSDLQNYRNMGEATAKRVVETTKNWCNTYHKDTNLEQCALFQTTEQEPLIESEDKKHDETRNRR